MFSPDDFRALIVDKDGTLLDFEPRLVALGRARLQGVLSQVDRDNGQELIEDLLRAWGLDLEQKKVDPNGPLAHASTDDEIAVTAGVLWCRGMDWHAARSAAEIAFLDVSEWIDPSASTVPLPGALHALRTLRGRGFRLALVTNDNQSHAEADVRELEVADLFDVVLGYTSGATSKPAPDMALQACRELGVSPQEAVAVGDAVYDAQMAQAAGVGLIVAVSTGLTPRERLEGHADVVIDSLADLPALLDD